MGFGEGFALSRQSCSHAALPRLGVVAEGGRLRRARGGVAQGGGVENERLLRLQRREVAAQEEAEGRTLRRERERVVHDVEEAHGAAGVRDARAIIRPLEAPDAVPVLQRRKGAGGDAADAAIAAGSGEIELGDGERLAELADPDAVLRAAVRSGHGVAVGAARGQAPRFVEEHRVVDVEVGVNIVEPGARQRVLHRLVPGGDTGKRNGAVQLVSHEVAEALVEARFGIGEEGGEGLGVEGVGDGVRDFIPDNDRRLRRNDVRGGAAQ